MKVPSPPTSSQWDIHSLVSSRSSAGTGGTKVSKRRSRAAPKPPITVLSADASNFQAMVQQLTGIPPPRDHLGLDTSYIQHMYNNHVINSSDNTYHLNTFSQLLACSFTPLLHPFSLPTLDTSSSLLKDHDLQRSLPSFINPLSPSSIATFNPSSNAFVSSSSHTSNANPVVARTMTDSGGAAAAFSLEHAFTPEVNSPLYNDGTASFQEVGGEFDKPCRRQASELEGWVMLQSPDSWLLAPLQENEASHTTPHYHYAPIQVHGA